MLPLIRSNKIFFAMVTLLAAAVRFFFVLKFPHFSGDSLIYGDIAKNVLLRGSYGLTELDQLVPTYIRLPGYPLFLAGSFAAFGIEHYNAVRFLQVMVDLGTCFIVAELARRVASA